MIKSIQSIYGLEISIGDNLNKYSKNNTDEKIVVSINERENGIIYRVNFKDNTYIDVKYKLLSKILE